MFCQLTPGCENYVEGRTMGCASCNAASRKASKVKLKVVHPVKKVSAKMAKKLTEYEVKRNKHLKDNPECQLKFIGCEKIAIEIHHTKPRAFGLNDEGCFMSACRYCHSRVHDVLSASERREKGYLK